MKLIRVEDATEKNRFEGICATASREIMGTHIQRRRYTTFKIRMINQVSADEEHFFLMKSRTFFIARSSSDASMDNPSQVHHGNAISKR